MTTSSRLQHVQHFSHSTRASPAAAASFYKGIVGILQAFMSVGCHFSSATTNGTSNENGHHMQLCQHPSTPIIQTPPLGASCQHIRTLRFIRAPVTASSRNKRNFNAQPTIPTHATRLSVSLLYGRGGGLLSSQRHATGVSLLQSIKPQRARLAWRNLLPPTTLSANLQASHRF